MKDFKYKYIKKMNNKELLAYKEKLRDYADTLQGIVETFNDEWTNVNETLEARTHWLEKELEKAREARELGNDYEMDIH